MKPIIDKNSIMMGMAMQQAETNRLLERSMMTPAERVAYDKQEREIDETYKIGCIIALCVILGAAILFGIILLAS